MTWSAERLTGVWPANHWRIARGNRELVVRGTDDDVMHVVEALNAYEQPVSEDEEPGLCGAIDESDFEDEDDAECELPAGHPGAHFARVDGGLNAYWTTDGSDVLTGEKPDEDIAALPCLASMGVHDCVRPQGHEGAHACDDECNRGHLRLRDVAALASTEVVEA